MPPHQLFFGLYLTEDGEEILKKVPPFIRNLLVQDQSPLYLQLVRDKGKMYLGKFLGEITNLQEIEAVQAHVISLLKKLNAELVSNVNSLSLIELPSKEIIHSDHLF